MEMCSLHGTRLKKHVVFGFIKVEVKGLDLEKRIEELEKNVAALEVQAQKQPKNIVITWELPTRQLSDQETKRLQDKAYKLLVERLMQ